MGSKNALLLLVLFMATAISANANTKLPDPGLDSKASAFICKGTTAEDKAALDHLFRTGERKAYTDSYEKVDINAWTYFRHAYNPNTGILQVKKYSSLFRQSLCKSASSYPGRRRVICTPMGNKLIVVVSDKALAYFDGEISKSNGMLDKVAELVCKASAN